MKELAGRLTALDPDAGAAVRVIAYFDRLAEGRAGLEALVRGAAVLAGVPARLVDVERRVHVRVEADGTRRESEVATDPAWPSAALTPGGAAALWLERAEQAEPSVVDAVILERAAGVIRLVLDRTRGRAPADDPALVETVLDASAPEAARLHAARRLGLDPAAPARVLVPLDGRPLVVPAHADVESILGRAGVPGRPGAAPPLGRTGVPAHPGAAPPLGRTGVPAHPGLAPAPGHVGTPARPGLAPTVSRTGVPAHPGPTPTPAPGRAGTAAHPSLAPTLGRVGVGSAVPVLELPRSWSEARVALRFTAEGTAQDPGPGVVHAEELGGVALLADLVAPGAEPPPDVQALEAAAAAAPWLLGTLHAVASTVSLRAAAAEVNVHHSTLQERLAHAEQLLGWALRTPQGRFRLGLALAMRHLARG
ncbi:helix-turn-helix domain-containing protein [Streptomyces sp. Y7]|uniref:helix-turn-helix domain-containing protein n=1 Tax=Streptomyces sp. Y7 TaxID=3342392 RepID=UPI0037105C18